MITQLVSVAAAAQELGIGRTKLYQLIGDGELSTVKVGRRRLVVSHSLVDFVAAQLTPSKANRLDTVG